jgi:hypothetical protein
MLQGGAKPEKKLQVGWTARISLFVAQVGNATSRGRLKTGMRTARHFSCVFDCFPRFLSETLSDAP